MTGKLQIDPKALPAFARETNALLRDEGEYPVLLRLSDFTSKGKKLGRISLKCPLLDDPFADELVLRNSSAAEPARGISKTAVKRSTSKI